MLELQQLLKLKIFYDYFFGICISTITWVWISTTFVHKMTLKSAEVILNISLFTYVIFSSSHTCYLCLGGLLRNRFWDVINFSFWFENKHHVNYFKPIKYNERNIRSGEDQREWLIERRASYNRNGHRCYSISSHFSGEN